MCCDGFVLLFSLRLLIVSFRRLDSSFGLHSSSVVTSHTVLASTLPPTTSKYSSSPHEFALFSPWCRFTPTSAAFKYFSAHLVQLALLSC